MTVRLFERKTLVQAFKLPLWGQFAEEVPPAWLVKRLQSGELTMNSLGGITMANRWGHQQCAAGDVVLLTEHDTIEFSTPEEFGLLSEPKPHRDEDGACSQCGFGIDD
ncbi:hypothetical protein ACFLEY_22570 [Bradyrhizobium sp. YCK136]|uniref:Uncharacterized protein n=1 Tax=Bradyrhizobium diazoefficiens TaxID=1355477 RepID=A0A0E4BWM2_9BRAD|nr:hypothetical protein NK6_8822 [Bradyrhizobium diazoefficiens]